MMSIRSGWPLAQWYLRAVLMAHSIASAPELVKNTTSAKVASVSASASRSWPGIVEDVGDVPELLGLVLQRLHQLRVAWPSAFTAMPAMQSR